MGSHFGCCVDRENIHPNLVKPNIPELKLGLLTQNFPQTFSSARVELTQVPELKASIPRKIKASSKVNKSEGFFNIMEKEIQRQHQKSDLNRASPKNRRLKKLESMPQKDFNDYEGAMQIIDEFRPNFRKKGQNNKEKSESMILDDEKEKKAHRKKMSSFIKIGNKKEMRKQNSQDAIVSSDNNEIEFVLAKIKKLKEDLKTIPKINTRRQKLMSINESQTQSKSNVIPQQHLLEFEEDTENEMKKQVLIENLNNNEETTSLEMEERSEECFFHFPTNKTQTSLTPQHSPLYQKHISYTTEFENISSDYDHMRNLKFLTSVPKMVNAATDTNDLLKNSENDKHEKKDKSTVSIELQTQETEPNPETPTPKLKNMCSPPNFRKINTDRTRTKNKPNIKKIDPKLKNVLQDLGKLKKLGFTFILKFTENSKPQVKVGGGYVSLEVFLGYILEKINKSNASKSPRNNETIDPELIQRLNEYLIEMNNKNLKKVENNRRESFQGRWTFSENDKISSPRGNFMKAVVEKDGSISPYSKKSLHLTEDFSISVMGGNSKTDKH